ncbi:MAG: 50S ribosomal protein L4, partial [Chloroflexota bacterium]|nr:50S ribosomal protein L4 [Chloroflexota bacterium]
MMQVPVYNVSGEVVDNIELNDKIFAAPIKAVAVHQAAVRQLANLRQETADTRTRGEVAGGSYKPWRQKGTGRARQGSTRAPQWRHGGIVFGPHPRDYR